ncbi:MAG: biotin/lipoyl-binding protein [Oscillospiraceae bacterium]|nr:biotin/lipoyl-binding protein [Oscillospiraceae bacterium]
MRYQITLYGRTYEVEVELAAPMDMQEFSAYAPAPAAPSAAASAPAAPEAAPVAAVFADGEVVAAPMPGNILRVDVSQGQTVKAGDVLVILEAMKMENEICAPRNGTVAQVVTTRGSVVDTGAPLVVIR